MRPPRWNNLLSQSSAFHKLAKNKALIKVKYTSTRQGTFSNKVIGFGHINPVSIGSLLSQDKLIGQQKKVTSSHRALIE